MPYKRFACRSRRVAGRRVVNRQMQGHDRVATGRIGERIGRRSALRIGGTVPCKRFTRRFCLFAVGRRAGMRKSHDGSIFVRLDLHNLIALALLYRPLPCHAAIGKHQLCLDRIAHRHRRRYRAKSLGGRIGHHRRQALLVKTDIIASALDRQRHRLDDTSRLVRRNTGRRKLLRTKHTRNNEHQANHYMCTYITHIHGNSGRKSSKKFSNTQIFCCFLLFFVDFSTNLR